jgi:hypothetical protein
VVNWKVKYKNAARSYAGWNALEVQLIVADVQLPQSAQLAQARRKAFYLKEENFSVACSVADPHHLDADPDLDPVCHSFKADPDPDPTYHFHADPDPDLTFHFDADPNPSPSFQIKAQNLK